MGFSTVDNDLYCIVIRNFHFMIDMNISDIQRVIL
jgi:hypothetical protein